MRGLDGVEEPRAQGAMGYQVALRLMKYVRPWRTLVLVSVLGMLLYSATVVANPWIIREAVDSVVTTGSTSDLTLAASLLVVNALLGYGTNYLQLLTLSRVGQNLLLGLRTSTFDHIQSLSLSYFDRTEAGSTMSRVQNDVQQLQEFLSIFVLALGDMLVLVGIVAAMLLMDWQLALITLSVVPVLFGVMALWQRYAWPSFMLVRRAMAEVNARLQENISGVRVVQGLNRQRDNLHLFDEKNQLYLDSSLRASRLSSALNPSVEVLTAISMGLIIIFGGIMVARGDLEVGIVVAFALYIQRLFDPIRSLTMQYGQLQRAMTSGQHIFELLDTPPKVVDRPGAAELPPLRGEVRFEDVGFEYDLGVRVLEGINLHIAAGQRVALVGPTGAGKTTLAALLSRLYDVTEGRITVDGRDLRDVARVSLNHQISVVPQEPFLFSGTIKNNIRYSREEARDEDVRRAARSVGAHEFIMKMDKGYDTPVEERGQNLSPGQRQLISMARALLPDPRIVILDEATATVDSFTEALVQRALDAVLKGRTAIIIAHRLSTVRNTDRIVVMDRGRIVEEGSHHELLARGGLFARLYALNRAV